MEEEEGKDVISHTFFSLTVYKQISCVVNKVLLSELRNNNCSLLNLRYEVTWAMKLIE
jgi:hypothetical protein